jgi:anti-sigma regulatory factor (Ser/Thr protein kinase)
MDSRSRQNHRSKKSWVPNVEINPLEVALVEVLNNIVKHAYCGYDTGLIEITCQPFDDFLSFDIVDAGLQMPDRCVPDNPLPRTNFPGTLPEGGFG